MLNKLTIRNVKRSSGDYLIYIVTMTVLAALMFAFNGMMFSRDLRALYQEIAIFAVLIGFASVFIIFIIIWLVHYMVNFMMEKRSREFGTYLLLGMKKKQIASIFRKENIILGFLSLLAGILPGMFFQIAFINIFYSVLDVEYRISPDFSPWNLLLTWGIFFLSYLLALFRVKRKFKKMTISSLIYLDRQNEKERNEKRTWKKYLVFLSLAYIVIFNIKVLTLRSSMTTVSIWGYIAGLIVAIYLLYIGLSSFFVSYIKKQHKGVYKQANIFVFRQLSSKIKTMRFTMGTLTVLFTTALLGWTVVMMFGDYQSREMKAHQPFDVLVFSEQTDDDFSEQLKIISEASIIEEQFIYKIYENSSDDFNEYLYENLGGTRQGEEGSGTYFGYDTYIGLSDYNYIRTMAGYVTVELEDNRYLIHCKERVKPHLKKLALDYTMKADNISLGYQGAFTEPLSQNGMNGADYIIVVPDGFLLHIQPYYFLLAVTLEGKAPSDLQERLLASQPYHDDLAVEDHFTIQYGYGSDQILVASDTALVRDNVIVKMGFVVVSICFICAYIGIVFLCAALTVLAVQQLSDSSKYKFRYTILKQLGLNKKETDKVVLKQLGVYYLCPFVISVMLSMFIGMFASERFVYYTGVRAGIFQYYVLAVLIFALLYLVYFLVTYVGFLRNIYK